MLHDHITQVGPCPCDDCPHQRACTESEIACYVYYQYVTFNKIVSHERHPTEAMYKKTYRTPKLGPEFKNAQEMERVR
jgi:hypothetical protein